MTSIYIFLHDALALDDAQFYLSKVQSPSRELQLMQAYLDLVSYLRTLSLDIVPVQLKMMIHSPAELTRLILHDLPLDFVSLESRPLNNVFRADEEENSDHEMQSFNGLENSCDGDDDDVFADAVLPAQQLMDLLLPLFKDDSDKAHVLLTVLERCTTRPLDDTRGSCLLCMQLLSSLSSLNLETQHVILEASHRVVETLKEKIISTSVQEGEQQHGARRLKSYLRKLRAAMLTNCPPSTLTTLSCSLFEVEAVEGMTLSEEQQLEAAERLLLRFIGKLYLFMAFHKLSPHNLDIGMLMIDASDPSFLLLPLPSAAETVSLCGCQGYLTDVVGLLRTVRHHQSRVHDLLERLQRDIQKKMTRIRSASAQNVSPSPTYKASSTPIKRRSSTGNTKDAETVFEGRVQLLMKKGQTYCVFSNYSISSSFCRL